MAQAYTLSRASRERLDSDREFALRTFERLLGPPKPSTLTRDWVSFRCPTPGCDREDYKFGVNFGSSPGGFNCYRCGLHGKGFTTLCRALDLDPGQYIEDTGTSGVPVSNLHSRVGQPKITVDHFASIWLWVAQQAIRAYGQDTQGLSAEHCALLARRGLDLNRIPPWFSMPPTDIVPLAIQRWGVTACQRAGLLFPESQTASWVFQPGRVALVYPTNPLSGHTVPFGYLRSYDLQPQTPQAKKRKLLSIRDHPSGDYPYVRADLECVTPTLWVLVEGEVKTEVSWHSGIQTFGLPGMNAGRTKFTRLLIQSLQRSHWANPSGLIVCFDTEGDPAAQNRVENAFYDLVDHLTKAIFDVYPMFHFPIYRLCLPSQDGQKNDVDAFVGRIALRSSRDTGYAAWRNALRAAVASGEAPPRPQNLQRTLVV